MKLLLVLGLTVSTLLSTSYSEIPYRNCTPSGQSIIQCRMYDSCILAENITASYSISNVRDLTTDLSYDGRSSYTSVDVSWRSMGVLELNKTRGYILRLYYYTVAGEKVELLCRYLEVWSIASSVMDRNTNAVFKTFVSSIQQRDTNITVEILTLPSNLHNEVTTKTFTTYKHKSFRRSIRSQVDQFPLNATYTNPKPFSVAVSFRRSSFWPEIDILYNHTYYESAILDLSNRAYFNDINGVLLSEIVRYPSNIEEYAQVQWDNVSPGTYLFEMWPYKKSQNCHFCYNETDHDNGISLEISVTGYDYKPSQSPVLLISEDYEPSVIFDMAPSSFFIDRYEIILRKLSDPINDLGRPSEWVITNTTDDWTRHTVTFGSIDVRKLFNIEDEIVAEVFPTMRDKLCKAPRYCNLNGSCHRCSRSVSDPVKMASPPTDPPIPTSTAKFYTIKPPTVDFVKESSTTTSIPFNSVYLSIFLPLSLVMAALLSCSVVFLCRRKRNTLQRRLEAEKNNIPPAIIEITAIGKYRAVPSSPTLRKYNFSDTESGLFMGTQPLVKICIAYSSGEATRTHYDKLYATLSRTLEKYFNCEVISYNQVCGERNSFELNSCDFALVLCSAELHGMHLLRQSRRDGFGGNAPSVMPKEMMYHSKVLDLLVTHRPMEKPLRIMATFDHLPKHYSTELQASSGNRLVDMYSLPKQLEEMVTTLCSRNVQTAGVSCKVSSWEDYKQNELMQVQLKSDIEKLASATREQLDSGLGDSMSLCLTITTEQQNTDYYEQTQPAVVERVPVETDNPVELELIGERNNTEIPRADEMQYLRQTSAESPTSPSSQGAPTAPPPVPTSSFTHTHPTLLPPLDEVASLQTISTMNEEVPPSALISTTNHNFGLPTHIIC